MKADSLSCKNLSAQYNLLASRNIALKNPALKERQNRIAKEIMDISNYLSKSANLIENTENKQLLFQPGKHNFTKYVNLNLVSQLTKQSRYSYGSIGYTASLKEWNKNYTRDYLNIPWWRSHPIHENRATKSIWTEPCNPLLRATKSTKRATSA